MVSGLRDIARTTSQDFQRSIPPYLAGTFQAVLGWVWVRFTDIERSLPEPNQSLLWCSVYLLVRKRFTSSLTHGHGIRVCAFTSQSTTYVPRLLIQLPNPSLQAVRSGNAEGRGRARRFVMQEVSRKHNHDAVCLSFQHFLLTE
jgi:hypothetical protein